MYHHLKPVGFIEEIDECFDWLYKAVDNQEPSIIQYVLFPGLDPLRSHSRYKVLLRKMNLEA
jgi:hypothetical protein